MTLGLKLEDGNLKLRNPTVKLNKSKLGLKPRDGNLKLRNPTVRLNRVTRNPFYLKINSLDKKDEKLMKMKTKVKLKKFPILKKII